MHLWYPRRFGYEVEPLTSTADGVATWPEIATSWACAWSATTASPWWRRTASLGLVLRRNPTRVSVEEYESRLRIKRITERWPRVRVPRT